MATAKNIYKASFTLNCPIGNEKIYYKLQIIAAHKIMVEQINQVIETFNGKGLHEDVADKMQLLGGKQKITATHQGVKIKTSR
jgi:hypothetical protein